MKYETVFSIDMTSIKYGFGVTGEVGYEMRRFGCKRVMVLSDPKMAFEEPVKVVLSSIKDQGIEAILYDQVKIEPTDVSFKQAAGFASNGDFDGFVAVGGGSTIDTAKAANLYASYPADFLTYVNAPIGKGCPVPGQLKPLVAIPTTTGTGSETTGVAIFDMLSIKAKTGIAHRALRPVMGLVDPNNTSTLPEMVIASSGLDVLCHGLESFTAMPFDLRQAPDSPEMRPAYQGANPISDVWASSAITMVANNLSRAVHDRNDVQARAQMLMASTFAGVGFGNAGVHLPHGMSYPVSGMVREYRPTGYPQDEPIIPHGISVALNAPAVFRFTSSANPTRHLEASRLMGADISNVIPADAGNFLSEQISSLLRDIGIPNGLRAVGYEEKDIDDLVSGTLPQHRVTKLSPRLANTKDLKKLFLESMSIW